MGFEDIKYIPFLTGVFQENVIFSFACMHLLPYLPLFFAFKIQKWQKTLTKYTLWRILLRIK